MKRTIKTVVFVVGMCLLVSPAWADIMKIKLDITDSGGAPNWGTNAGGEFTAKVLSSSPVGIYQQDATFKTFCVEYDENVSNGGEYWVDISANAVYGGSNIPNPPPYPQFDPLDTKTAYLYATYAPAVASDADANDLQYAIWYIEGEVTSLAGKAGAIALYNAAVDATETGSLIGVGSTDGIAIWSGLGNVRVMNLWSDPTVRTWDTAKQSLLVLVPAPAAVGLGLLGLGLVGWVKRRMA